MKQHLQFLSHCPMRKREESGNWELKEKVAFFFFTKYNNPSSSLDPKSREKARFWGFLIILGGGCESFLGKFIVGSRMVCITEDMIKQLQTSMDES